MISMETAPIPGIRGILSPVRCNCCRSRCTQRTEDTTEKKRNGRANKKANLPKAAVELF